MKNAIILKTLILSALCFAAGCRSETSTNPNASDSPITTNANTNGATRADTKTTNSNIAPETPKAETEKLSDSSLATPTEAYKTAYAARKNKDIPTLKRVMSKDALEFMSIFVEPGKTVDDALLQMTETPQAATDAARNEKITGDKATLEYPNAEGQWKTMDFVKENGEWKLTMPKADAPGGGKAK